MDDSLTSKNLCDLSFAGSTVVINGHTISQFMDDANPVEFQNLEVSGVGVNCNGKMIRYAKPSAVMMSVTVIPGGADDGYLYGLLKQYHVEDAENNGDQWEQSIDCDINIDTTGFNVEYHFAGGTMVSGPGGPGSSAEGKMQGRTYTFAFASIKS